MKSRHGYRFTTKAVLMITDIPRTKFNSWLFRELIKPANPSQGQGYAAEFSVENIVQFELIDAFKNAGLALRKSAEMAEKSVSLGGEVLINLKTGKVRKSGQAGDFEMLLNIDEMETTVINCWKNLENDPAI